MRIEGYLLTEKGMVQGDGKVGLIGIIVNSPRTVTIIVMGGVHITKNRNMLIGTIAPHALFSYVFGGFISSLNSSLPLNDNLSSLTR